MTRVIAFGCGHTRGEGLDDIYDKRTKENTGQSKFAWPKIVADNLSVPCLNFGQGGIGNKKIWHNILDFYPEIQKDDIVIVQWTYLERNTVFFNDRDPGQNIGLTLIKNTKANPVDRTWFEYLYARYDQRLDLFLRADHIAKTLDCRLLQFRTYEDIVNHSHTKPKWYGDQIIDRGLADYKCDLALDDQHFGKNTHLTFAKYIIDKLDS